MARVYYSVDWLYLGQQRRMTCFNFWCSHVLRPQYYVFEVIAMNSTILVFVIMRLIIMESVFVITQRSTHLLVLIPRCRWAHRRSNRSKQDIKVTLLIAFCQLLNQRTIKLDRPNSNQSRKSFAHFSEFFELGRHSQALVPFLSLGSVSAHWCHFQVKSTFQLRKNAYLKSGHKIWALISLKTHAIYELTCYWVSKVGRVSNSTGNFKSFSLTKCVDVKQNQENRSTNDGHLCLFSTEKTAKSLEWPVEGLCMMHLSWNHWCMLK